MMESWKEVELEHVAYYVKDRCSFDEINKSNYISADNMNVDIGGINSSDYVPKKGNVSKFVSEDILISNIRPYFKKMWFSTFQGGCSNDVFIIRLKSQKIISKFLFYQLSQQKFFDFMMAGANGTKMPRGNKNAIIQFRINLPPLPTQQKIASILSAYDDLIENNLKRIKLLEEMAQQTYEEWFVRMRFPGYEDAVIKEETGLPEGWEKVELVSICDLVMGQSPNSQDYNQDGIGLPFHQGVKDYGYRFPINISWSKSGNKIGKSGSILFSVRAPVGRLNVSKEDIILGRGLAAINSKKGYNSFIYYQLKKIFFEDNLIGGGAIFASVTKKDVESIDLIFEEKLVKSFNEFAKKIDKNILNLTNQNQRLKEARDILLPRLMSGMIEV